ncbi:hypothetical protein ICE17_004494 [Salmonella enterica subsp. enterica serovar Bredeney]|nr:hypothetical protein [Salmonella enterica subsp. enterica serovar Bredeney]
MATFNLPDIYGRNYLINFDAVKYIQVSDNEERGDLIIIFTDQAKQVISVGLDREGAMDTLEHISRVIGSVSLTGKNKLWR